MKKMLWTLLIFTIIVCMVTGCTEEATSEEILLPEESVIQKVALITDCGSVDDQGHDQACWEGVESWCTPRGIEFTYYQPEEDCNDARIMAVDQAVAEGSNVIVMSDYLFGTVLAEVQEKYPHVYFVAVDLEAGDMTYDYMTFYEPAANAVCFSFAEEEAGYLAGYATVKEGYTQLGYMGGLAVPEVIRYGYGYVQGADAAAIEMGVDIHIKYTYNGGCTCGGIDLYRNKIKSWEESGTEIFFLYDGHSLESFPEDMNAHIIAPNVDKSYIGSKVLTSAIKELKNTVEYALSGLHEGRWETDFGGKFINLSLQDGDFVGLPTTEESFRFKIFTLQEYEALKNDIRAGVRIVDDSTERLPKTSSHTVVEEVG